jgi:hypothetical protein
MSWVTLSEVGPDGDALVLEVEQRVGSALVGALLDRLDGVEDRHVDALDRAREDVRAEVGLVLVDPDPPLPLLLGRVEGAEATPAGNLEDGLRALGDLVQRELLALVLRAEVLREPDEDLDAWVAGLRAVLVAGD